MTETADQIYRQALEAGWTGGAARTITAIALAESGGNASAYNGKAPDNSYGLTQINMIGNLGAPRRKEFGITSNNALLDPVTNLKAALHVYNDAGGKFTPWSTYTSGSYKKFADTTNAAANRQGDLIQHAQTGQEASAPNLYSVATGSADAVTGGITSATGAAVSAWNTLSSKSFWVRVSFILGGLIILLIGVSQLTKGGTLSEPTPATPITPNNRPSVASRATAVSEGA